MMGLFDRIKNLARTLIKRSDYARVGHSSRTMAGVAITPDTAVTISAVWACLRYLSQTVAGLPWHVMRDGESGAEIVSRGTPDYLIYRRPNKEWSSFQFRETLTHWALRWGNAFAEIERDQMGRPFALWPIHPERVLVCRDPESGEIFYEVTGQNGGKIEIPAVDMFHIRGFGEGVVGVNVIDYAAQSLGWARAAQLFGATFFGNGANVSGMVVHKKKLTDSGLRRVKAEFDQLFKGIKNSHGVVHTDTDADFKKFGLNAQETQLVEVHYFLIEEVCRWFGVPPHKVAHLLRATFSNIEHQAIEVVVDSVMPWVQRFEDEANFKLFGEANRLNLYTKMNLRGLLRGDFKSQNEGLEVARRNGVVDADEWRDFIGMNKMKSGKGGDKFVMQSQFTTLDKIGEVETQPSAPSQSSTPPAEKAAQNRLLALADMETETV